MTLCRVLTDLGVYPTLRRGRPSVYDSPEESRRAQKEQLKIATCRRRQLLREAAANGEPPRPVFKRGRPRIYATEEEALAARKRMNKVCMTRHEELLEEAFETLRGLVAASRDTQVNSTDEQKNVSVG